MVYELKNRRVFSPYFAAQNCLFGAVKITQNSSNSDHNKYVGYGICFDIVSNFSFGNITDAKNVIILGADMSFSSHSTNKANNIYVLGKDSKA